MNLLPDAAPCRSGVLVNYADHLEMRFTVPVNPVQKELDQVIAAQGGGRGVSQRFASRQP